MSALEAEMATEDIVDSAINKATTLFWAHSIFQSVSTTFHRDPMGYSALDSTSDGQIPQIDEAFYMDLFIKYFVQHPHDSIDDLLFFVTKSGNDSKLPQVVVKRKTSDGRLPQLEDIMDWEASLYLNCITQMRYLLIVSICSRTTSSPSVKQQVRRIVYAVPSASLHMSSKEHPFVDSYPLIYFTIDDFDQVFGNMHISPGDYICVELNAILTDDATFYEKEENTIRQPGACMPLELPLFQGAVSYEAVSKTWNKKSLSKDALHHSGGQSDREFILMRGPNGKGQAQAAVRPSKPHSWFKRSLGWKSSFQGSLQCQLTFVNLHWEHIIHDVMDEYKKIR